MEVIILSNVDNTSISGIGLWSIYVNQEPSKLDKLVSGVDKGHDTQPQYWNKKPRPSSCYTITQEKYLTRNKNLWWSIDQSDHLPNTHDMWNIWTSDNEIDQTSNQLTITSSILYRFIIQGCELGIVFQGSGNNLVVCDTSFGEKIRCIFSFGKIVSNDAENQ